VTTVTLGFRLFFILLQINLLKSIFVSEKNKKQCKYTDSVESFRRTAFNFPWQGGRGEALLGGPLKNASGDLSRGKQRNNMEGPENEYQEIRDRKTYFKKDETSKARQWLTIMVVISGD
jgi:hypothetical protein